MLPAVVDLGNGNAVPDLEKAIGYQAAVTNYFSEWCNLTLPPFTVDSSSHPFPR